MKSLAGLFSIPTQECFKCGNWVRESNRKFMLCNVCEHRSDPKELIQFSLLRGMPYEETELSADFLDSLEAREIDEGMLAEYIKAFEWREVFPESNYSMTPVKWIFYLSVLAQEQRIRCEELLDEVIGLREKSQFREDVAKFETEKYLSEMHGIALSTLRDDIKYLRRLGFATIQELFDEVQDLVVSVWEKDSPSARAAFNCLSQRMLTAKALRNVDEQIRQATGHRLMEVSLGLRKISDLGLAEAQELDEVEAVKLVDYGLTDRQMDQKLLAKAADAADFYWMFKVSNKNPSPKYIEAAKDLENAYDPGARRQNHPALEPINELVVTNRSSWARLLDNFRWSYEFMFETEKSFIEALATLFGSSHREKLIPIFCNLPANLKELAVKRKAEHLENQEETLTQILKKLVK